MRFEVTISKRGTFTIPAALRKKLGISAGQRVQQRLQGNAIIFEFGERPAAATILKGTPVRKK
jgi:AbrB family looped-hinge helix DNA binding protein